MEAASTADAPPSRTAATKSSGPDAPPDAITGTCTRSVIARSRGVSKPAPVPSRSIEVTRSSPAPATTARTAQASASRPVASRPPLTTTSTPPLGSSGPARRRASIATTTAWLPNRRAGPDDPSGGWEVVVKGGREATGLDALAWAVRAVVAGAGELLVTSIDRDGTGAGFDTPLLRAITDRVHVPVIASGGASGPDDFVAAVRDGGASAVLAASIFHRRRYSIADVKAVMAAAGIPVRLAAGAVA